MTKETTVQARSRFFPRARVLATGLLAPLLTLASCSSTSNPPAPSTVTRVSSTEMADCSAPDPRQEASDRFHRGKAHALAGDPSCARLEFDAALEGFRRSMRPGDSSDVAFAGHLWDSVRLYESIQETTEEDSPGARGGRDGLVAQDGTPPTADQVAVARREIEEAASSVVFDVPIIVNEAVLNAVAFYQFRTPKAFASALQRSGRYLPLMRSILRESGLPEDLVYIAMIESAFKSQAHSRAAARGYWQFIDGTGHRYGLKRSRDLDERSDPVKSTRAAAAYFRDLYEIFGDWHLAMAAYNAGEGRVLRGLQRTGARNYWDLRDRGALHRETRDYVPFFIASALIAKDPARFGFDVVLDPPLAFDVVELSRPLELGRVARELGTSLETLRALNGELRGSSTPRGVSAYPLRIPRGAGPALTARLSSLPAAPEYRDRKVRVRKGETVVRFAARNRIAVADLRAANDLKPNARLRSGSFLLVPSRVSAKAPRRTELAEAADAPAFPDPVRGEIRALPTPSAAVFDAAALGQDFSLAQAAPRTPAPLPTRVEIPASGFVETARIAPASRRTAPKAASARRARTHTVQKGETLYRIATRYGVSIHSLRRANRIGRSTAIRPGQHLTVPSATGR